MIVAHSPLCPPPPRFGNFVIAEKKMMLQMCVWMLYKLEPSLQQFFLFLQKSEFILVSCLSRVTNCGLKALQRLSRHISRSAGRIWTGVDRSSCMWRGGLLEKQLDSVLNTLATAPLTGCGESKESKRLSWCETCRHAVVTQHETDENIAQGLLKRFGWASTHNQSNKINSVVMMEVWL